MIRGLIAVAAIAALGSACGGSGSTTGSATFNGTVKGQSFTPKDAQSTSGSVPVSSTLSINAGSIVITDQVVFCGNVTANKEAKSSHYLVMVLSTITQISPTLVTVAASTNGDYIVFNPSAPAAATPPNVAVVFGQTTDATCHDVSANDAVGVSGTVHLTSASNGVYAGSYDVKIAAVDSMHNAVNTGTTEHITGTFNTAACAGLSPAISLTRTLTCF